MFFGKIANREVALSVYYVLVQSHLAYGIALWGSCSDENLERVFKLQKRAVRYVCGLSTGDSCAPYFKSLKILTIQSLYALEVCMIEKKEKWISRN